MSVGDDNEDFFDYARTAPAAHQPPPYYPAPAQYPMPPYPGPYFPPPGAASMPYPPGQYYPQGPPPPYPGDPYAAARQPGPLRNLDGSLAMPSAAVRRPPPRKVRDEPSETELFDFLPEPQVRDMEEPAPVTSGSRLPGLSRLSEVRGWAGRLNRRQQLDPSQMTSDANRLPDVDTAYEDAHPTILNEDEKPALYDLTQDFYVVNDETQATGNTVLTAPDGTVYKFRYGAMIPYAGEEYAVLLEMELDENGEEQVLITKVEKTEDGSLAFVVAEEPDVIQTGFDKYIQLSVQQKLEEMSDEA